MGADFCLAVQIAPYHEVALWLCLRRLPQCWSQSRTSHRTTAEPYFICSLQDNLGPFQSFLPFVDSGKPRREGTEGLEIWRGGVLGQCRVLAVRVTVQHSCQEEGQGLLSWD